MSNELDPVAAAAFLASARLSAIASLTESVGLVVLFSEGRSRAREDGDFEVEAVASRAAAARAPLELPVDVAVILDADGPPVLDGDDGEGFEAEDPFPGVPADLDWSPRRWDRSICRFDVRVRARGACGDRDTPTTTRVSLHL